MAASRLPEGLVWSLPFAIGHVLMRAQTWIIAGGTALIATLAALPTLTGRSLEAWFTDVTVATRNLTQSTVRQPTAPTATTAPAQPPSSVTLSQPLRREIIEWDETTGRFDAVATVDLKARVNGYLQAVLFKDGQDVAKGDPLFLIDPRPYERVLAQAQAELAQAQTKIANAGLDVERGRPLLQRKVLSEKVFDDRESVQREAESLARIAEAKVQAAQLDLTYTQIVAPVAGRIGRTLVTPGNYIGGAGGSAASSATTLATIVSQDPIYAYFDMTEADALKYKRLAASQTTAAAKADTRVEAALPDDTGYPHVGRIDFVDNRLDGATGSLRARAVFENKDRLFTPGQFVKLRLQGSANAVATLVPDEAIGSDQGNRYVVVVGADDIPTRRAVVLGPVVEGLRVVRSGVTADDWIVIKGLTRVRPGQKVAPKREPLKLSLGADAPGATVPR
jgi:RND family efflux transporter MFP subunit